MASANPEFGTTLARRLNQSHASAMLQLNLGRSTTSELGLNFHAKCEVACYTCRLSTVNTLTQAWEHTRTQHFLFVIFWWIREEGYEVKSLRAAVSREGRGRRNMDRGKATHSFPSPNTIRKCIEISWENLYVAREDKANIANSPYMGLLQWKLFEIYFWFCIIIPYGYFKDDNDSSLVS